MNTTDHSAKRILVAEDVPSLSALITSLLQHRGYTVESASDGEACLAKLTSFQPDLLVLDIMLPKLHGIEVLRRMHTDPAMAGVGVIVCTSLNYKNELEQVRALGVFDVLLKPFQKDALIELVNRFFSGSAKPAETAPATAATAAEVYQPKPVTGPSFHCWGTRGSIPVCGAQYIRHGGNTACLEVSDGENLLICDAGSGIRELGLALAKSQRRNVHLFVSHTHWDHIQGFPFFTPAYIPGFELHVYGACGFKKDLGSVFRGQLDSAYFPVQFEDMRADIQFHTLETPPLRVGKFEVSWEYTHHPAATYAYKFTCDGRSLAYVSDNEFLQGYLGSPHELNLESELVALHRPIIEFVKGVDLLIAEAQYPNADYRCKVGWGHSSIPNACALAALGKVKRWLVTHHDPEYDDNCLDAQLNVTRQIMHSLGHPIEVRHAYDGLAEQW